MKRTILSIFFAVVIGLCGFCAVMVYEKDQTHTEYLRIHIRANSNEDIDQQVKYKVKDAIVEYLTPYLSNCHTKEDAERIIDNNLHNITNVADSVLKSNGFSYTSRAKINNEKFPTRVYEDLTLESGFYDALIVELGSGCGDNWWCVVYPPLCFLGSGNYIYKSKIREIINEFIMGVK